MVMIIQMFMENLMQKMTNITSQEAWRILDAIIAYKNDYELSAPVIKTIKNVEKKMKKIVDEE